MDERIYYVGDVIAFREYTNAVVTPVVRGVHLVYRASSKVLTTWNLKVFRWASA